MTTRVGQIIGLFLLLPVGAIVVLLVSGMFRHRYDDSGFGSFYGEVHGRFFTEDFFIGFRGRTQPRWRWVHPENYTYKSLDIEWAGKETAGSGKLILPSCVLERFDSSGIVAEDDLRELLTGGEHDGVSPAARSVVERVYLLSVDAGRGKLPLPRHHSYSYDEPAGGSLTHFSLGWRFPYSILVWVLVWVCIVGYYIGRQATGTKSEAKPQLADRHGKSCG